MSELGERLAVAETQMKGIFERLDHLDFCLDEVKKAVWKSTGVAIGILAIVQILLRMH